MASALDFSKFAFTAEQIRDVRDLIWEDIVKAPEFANLVTIYPDIVAGKQVGFIGKGGLVIKADAGCGSNPSNWQIGTRVITWAPIAWEGYVRECYKDLEATAAVYALNKGAKVADLTDTDYMAIVAEVFGESIKESIFAIMWFGDTQSATAEISLLDGFDKQMNAQITANAAQSVTLNAATIVNDIVAMIQAASPVLRADKSAKVYASQAVFDALVGGLVSANASTIAYTNLVDGMQVVKVLGYEVVALPLFDELAALYNTPAKVAYFTAPKYLGLGVDSEGFGEVSIDYEPSTKYTHIRAMGKMDAKLVNPTMFVKGVLA